MSSLRDAIYDELNNSRPDIDVIMQLITAWLVSLSEEERERCDEIAKRLYAVPNLPWDFGASYEIWQRQEWGARRVASITEVPNDTEDATGRYSVVDFIAHAPDDVRWLLGLAASRGVLCNPNPAEGGAS